MKKKYFEDRIEMKIPHIFLREEMNVLHMNMTWGDKEMRAEINLTIPNSLIYELLQGYINESLKKTAEGAIKWKT